MADQARRDERATIMAVDRWQLIGVVLAAGIPLLICYLVLRECGRKDPQIEEVVEHVSKALLVQQRSQLEAGRPKGELPVGKDEK